MVEVTEFIEGLPVSSDNSESIAMCKPASGQHSMIIPAACNADVNRVVASSRHAFDDGRWSALLPSKRNALLHSFADLIDSEAEDLNRLDALDMGKPLSVGLGNAASAARYVR